MGFQIIPDDDAWHELVGATGSLNMQVLGGYSAQFLKAGSQPVTTDSEEITLDVEQMYSPNIEAANDMYAKAISGSTKIGWQDA